MTQSRRALFSTSAVAALAAAGLAACTPTNVATAETFIVKVESVLNYASPILSVLSIAYPPVAPFVPLFQKALSAANDIFVKIDKTMTVAAAQPIAQQVVTGISGALDVADQAVAVIPNAVQRVNAQAIVVPRSFVRE